MAKSVTWAWHVLLSARRTLRCLLLHLYMDFSRFFEAACLTLLAWLRVFVMRPVLLTTWLQKWSIRLIIMTILPTGGPLGCWCLCFGCSGAFGFKVEFASEKWVGSVKKLRRCCANNWHLDRNGNSQLLSACPGQASWDFLFFFFNSFDLFESCTRPFDDEELEDTGERLLAIRRSQEWLVCSRVTASRNTMILRQCCSLFGRVKKKDNIRGWTSSQSTRTPWICRCKSTQVTSRDSGCGWTFRRIAQSMRRLSLPGCSENCPIDLVHKRLGTAWKRDDSETITWDGDCHAVRTFFFDDVSSSAKLREVHRKCVITTFLIVWISAMAQSCLLGIQVSTKYHQHQMLYNPKGFLMICCMWRFWLHSPSCADNDEPSRKAWIDLVGSQIEVILWQ